MCANSTLQWCVQQVQICEYAQQSYIIFKTFEEVGVETNLLCTHSVEFMPKFTYFLETLEEIFSQQ